MKSRVGIHGNRTGNKTSPVINIPKICNDFQISPVNKCSAKSTVCQRTIPCHTPSCFIPSFPVLLGIIICFYVFFTSYKKDSKRVVIPCITTARYSIGDACFCYHIHQLTNLIPGNIKIFICVYAVN